jgi:hypothetical protein
MIMAMLMAELSGIRVTYGKQHQLRYVQGLIGFILTPERAVYGEN